MQNDNHKILKLYTSDNETKQPKKAKSLELTIGGIAGDKYFQREDREILITSTIGYELALKNGISMIHGTLGENILTDMNLNKFKIGDKFKIGEAIIQISMFCPICRHLSIIKKELPNLIKNDRGIFAKVIKCGEINIGDEIIAI